MIKILATADLHLGRRPTKLSSDEQSQKCSCASMWELIVDRAIDEQVDVVALAGDIVDHANRFFEATGPLERGIRRLAEQGIRTFAVAGNHDYDVFPRVVRDLGPELFCLLGATGKWESVDFERNGKVAARFQGWSFPAAHQMVSPMADYNLSADGSVPTIGLMHADLDVLGSRYAPITRGELAATNNTVWILGHNHRPIYLESGGGAKVLYPGSPQAMDPGETGPHGPWILEIEGAHRVNARQIPLSRVVYDELRIDLTGTRELDDVEFHVQSDIGDYLRGLPENDLLQYAVLRLRLLGETPLCAELEAVITRIREDFDRTVNDVTACIDRVVNNTQPQINLNDLAQRHDPPGVLAQLLLQLESGSLDKQTQQLLHTATQKIRVVNGHGAYAVVKEIGASTQDEAREYVRRAGMSLLSALQSQRAD